MGMLVVRNLKLELFIELLHKLKKNDQQQEILNAIDIAF